MKINNKSNTFLSCATKNFAVPFFCKKIRIAIKDLIVLLSDVIMVETIDYLIRLIFVWESEAQNTPFLCESVDTNSKKSAINLKELTKLVFLKTSPRFKL